MARVTKESGRGGQACLLGFRARTAHRPECCWGVAGTLMDAQLQRGLFVLTRPEGWASGPARCASSLSRVPFGLQAGIWFLRALGSLGVRPEPGNHGRRERKPGFGMAQGTCPGSLCWWQQSRRPTVATILSPSYFRSSRAGPSVPSPEVLARFLYRCRELPALRGPVCCLPGRGCCQKPPEELFQENIPAWKVLRGPHQLLAKVGAMETNPQTVRPRRPCAPA